MSTTAPVTLGEAGASSFCALTVDLDEIDAYHAIHGLPAGRAGMVYDLGVERFAAWAASLDVPLTFFAVGRDAEDPGRAARLAELEEAGHRVESHSGAHAYGMSRWSRAAIDADLARGVDALAAAVGRRPEGFRAPGYTLSRTLLDGVEAAGFAWDSSVFACAPYQAAKALVRGAMGLVGRRSASILDSPAALLAPTDPYRPSASGYGRGARGLLELPITVSPWGQLPMLGTLLGAVGAQGAARIASSCAPRSLVNVEFHGIDLLDRRDGLDDLAAHQPDLRVPWSRKRDAYSATVDTLRRQGRAFVTLAEAARMPALTPPGGRASRD